MTDQASRERRRRRSDETIEAITYQLDYVRNECGMEVFLLADVDGLIVASVGDEDHAELLAAYIEPLASGLTPDVEAILKDTIPSFDSGRIRIQSFEVDRIPMYLCALTDLNDTTRAGFERALTGIQRIYRTTSLLAQAD